MPKGQEKQSQAKIKRMMCLMDSMTDEELDTTNLKILQAGAHLSVHATTLLNAPPFTRP